jgi:hypothetical protein
MQLTWGLPKYGHTEVIFNFSLTKVFAKAGLDNRTSAMGKHQQWFGLDVQFSALVLNFNNIFSIGHLFRAGHSMNSLPSQILDR